MKVIVLGSGVIGVTSAYYLNKAGHEVTVIDRADAPGRETSFANGGQVSWGAGGPWAAPGIAWTACKWLFKPHSPLVLRPRLDPAMWSWMLQFLRNATPARYAINKERMLRLARYSHACMQQLRQETGIHYDEQTRGTLILFRTQQDLDKAAADTALLDRFGVPYQLLSRSGCLAHEPALKPVKWKIVGGVHYPEDESGDCHLFTHNLAQLAEKAGVRFQMQTTINRLETSAGDQIARIVTDRGEFAADAYVLACGSYSPLLLRPLGIRLPVYPLKGYSITIPVTHPDAAPIGTLSDETYKVVITRLGDRLRAAGTAELAGYDLSLPRRRCETLAHVLRDLFPHAGDFSNAEYWTGLRPMTPDNPPVLGVTPYKNLFLNTGHGTLGWTMSCGSGRVLANVVAGRRSEVDLDGLTLARFG
ncbi:MAG: D-amino acid dehydrogenase [Pseudomonadota bacterium]